MKTSAVLIAALCASQAVAKPILDSEYEPIKALAPRGGGHGNNKPPSNPKGGSKGKGKGKTRQDFDDPYNPHPGTKDRAPHTSEQARHFADIAKTKNQTPKLGKIPVREDTPPQGQTALKTRDGSPSIHLYTGSDQRIPARVTRARQKAGLENEDQPFQMRGSNARDQAEGRRQRTDGTKGIPTKQGQLVREHQGESAMVQPPGFVTASTMDNARSQCTSNVSLHQH